MTCHYGPDVSKKVDELISQYMEGAPVVSVFKQLTDHLKSKGVMQTMELNAKMLMVHEKNRGGLGVNPFNVHRNGAVIAKIGADRGQLNNAFCFEVSPHAEKRQAQFEFNNNLVRASGGLLACMHGTERYRCR